MYDVVIVGQGLTGMLSAIIARQQKQKVALVSKGAGKLLQSTGVMDLIPGSDATVKEWFEQFGINNGTKLTVKESVKKFKQIMDRIGYPYQGDIETPVSIVTASGNVKSTALYPETIKPLPVSGNVVIVGFHEIVDFQPNYVKENLQKQRPNLKIDTVKVTLNQQSLRTMTQTDAARLLDNKELRTDVIAQIKKELEKQSIKTPDLFIFPSSLGFENWKDVISQLEQELGADITEAVGMPPNATAIRLHERLRKESIKLGVRFFNDTQVCATQINNDVVEAITLKTSNRKMNVKGQHYIIATGGVLGGGLEVIGEGLKETALQLDVDINGTYKKLPKNVYPVGAANGLDVVHYGITGGVYSIYSSYDAVTRSAQTAMRGVQHA